MGLLRSLVEARDMRRLKRDWIRHHKLDAVRLLQKPASNAIICVIVVHNEALRIADCLRHHREIGVGRFVIIDNASVDETREILLDQPDVDLYYTSDNFSEARSGSYWYDRIVEIYGYDRWYVVIDADELLVYSGMHRHDLNDLAIYLRSWGSKALYAPMIDMYSNLPFSEVDYRPGERMVDACPFFDGDSYRVTRRRSEIVRVDGGPRHRLLGNPGQIFDNYLGKYPFLFWTRTVRRRNIHDLRVHGHAPAPSGALLHFKFLGDFSEKVDVAVNEKKHWSAGLQYRAYQAGIAEGKFDSLYYEGSRLYNGPETLVSAYLMNRIHWGAKRPTKYVIGSLLTGRPLRSAINSLDG